MHQVVGVSLLWYTYNFDMQSASAGVGPERYCSEIVVHAEETRVGKRETEMYVKYDVVYIYKVQLILFFIYSLTCSTLPINTLMSLVVPSIFTVTVMKREKH